MKNMSAGEVAKELGCEYFRVIRMIKRGQFPDAFKVGWGWVIPTNNVYKKEVKEYLKSKKKKFTKKK